MVSKYSNPYDFINPVKDPKLFAGRNDELKEVDYYLELTKSEKPQYTNLAILGERAVGKTSFLNIVSSMSDDKNLLPVKISLNQEISQNEILFFKEIIEGIMLEGSQKGMYGGIRGNIYRRFRKIMDTFDSNVQIPLLFGTLYIGKKKNDLDITIPQRILIHDLKELFNEAKKKDIHSIILLFDECDLLAQNEVLLQKIRNVFMDVDGYLLVFAGTNRMFPKLNELFSPLPRFFKRINLGYFKNIEETKECIFLRLNDEEKKIVNQVSIAELHHITQGNPYEVQLISHYMYKRYQETQSSEITFDTTVLDNVMKEIDRFRSDGHHIIADSIKRCRKEQVKVILSALEFPKVTNDQLSRFIVLSEIYEVELGNINSRLSYWKLIIQSLISRILTVDGDGYITFAGDQFDRLYLKYYSVSRGMTEFFFAFTNEAEINFQHKLSNVLLKHFDEYEINARFDEITPSPTQEGFKSHKFIFESKFTPKESKPGEWVTVLEFTPAELQKKFYLGDSNSIRFRVNVTFLDTGFVNQISFNKREDLDKLNERLKELDRKFELLGIQLIKKDEIDWNTEGINLRKEKRYDEAINAFEKGIQINPNLELAWANMGATYFEMENYEKALECFHEWTELRPRLAAAWEHKGRAYILLRKNDDALECLEKSVKLQPDVWSAWDNRGRALLNLGKYEDAIESFERALELKPENHEANFFKGICFSRLERFEIALESYNKALELSSDHVPSLKNKILVLGKLGKYDEALCIINNLLDEFPQNVEILMNMSLILSELGHFENAIKYCDKILEMDKKNSLAWYNKACFKARLDLKKEAILNLKKAVELDTKLIEVATTEKDFDSIRDSTEFKDIIKLDK